MRLVETPLRQKQLSKGRKTWKCAGSRGEGEHTLGQEGGHRPRGGKTKTGEGADSQGREIASQKAQGEEKSYNNILVEKALCGQKQREDETEEKEVGRKGTGAR